MCSVDLTYQLIFKEQGFHMIGRGKHAWLAFTVFKLYLAGGGLFTTLWHSTWRDVDYPAWEGIVCHEGGSTLGKGAILWWRECIAGWTFWTKIQGLITGGPVFVCLGSHTREVHHPFLGKVFLGSAQVLSVDYRKDDFNEIVLYNECALYLVERTPWQGGYWCPPLIWTGM